MDIKIKSGHSTKKADTNTFGSYSGLTVNTPVDKAGSGHVIACGEVDSGSIFSSSTIRQLYVTQDYRLSRNLEKPLWQDNFPTNVISNTKYKVTTSTQTITSSGGFLNLNAGNDVSNGTYCVFQTFKTFSLYENFVTYVNIKAEFSTTLKTNCVTEFGLGLAATNAAPTDAIFWRVSGATMNAVVNKGGLETISSNVQVPLSGVVYDYLLAISDDTVEFWIDDVIVAIVTPPITTGTTSLSNALPLTIRNYNTGVVPSAIQFKIGQVDVLAGDYKSNKDWATTMSTKGQNSIAFTDGQAAIVTGTTSANIVNNSATTVSVLNNISVGYTTIGGEFATIASAGTETDLIVFGYLNPAATSSIPGRTLVIQNVYINLFTSGATMGASPTLFQWSLGVGGTSASLLELDSVTTGTRAPRRIGLGCQTMAATVAVGSLVDRPIIFESPVPIIVEAGTYMHLILKMPIGLATASLVYRGMATINGYFE